MIVLWPSVTESSESPIASGTSDRRVNDCPTGSAEGNVRPRAACRPAGCVKSAPSWSLGSAAGGETVSVTATSRAATPATADATRTVAAYVPADVDPGTSVTVSVAGATVAFNAIESQPVAPTPYVVLAVRPPSDPPPLLVTAAVCAAGDALPMVHEYASSVGVTTMTGGMFTVTSTESAATPLAART